MKDVVNKKISVITASYNYENYIKETIESVLNQTVKDWEMIIVDDGSKDNSVEVIKSYCKKDERIKLYQHEGGVNKGLIETIKLGAEKATGEWIVFLESDDTISPDYLEEKIKIAKQYPQINFIFNDVNLFGDEQGIKQFDEYITRTGTSLKELEFPCNIGHLFSEINPVATFSAVMIKRETLKSLKFDSAVPQWIDYYLWSQLAGKYDFYYIDKKLTNFRIHKNSYNNKKISVEKRTYFINYCIKNNIENDKKVFFNYIKYLILLFRIFKRKIIRIHPKDNEITIFGKKYPIKRPKKKKYDLIFSVGEACFCSLALRRSELQYASYPFDWIGGSNFANRGNILSSKFENFFEKENLEYFEQENNEKSYAYHDNHHKISFIHDFPVTMSFDDAYKMSKEKYNRRIKRLLEQIEKAKSVLVVYIEIPSTNHRLLEDEDIINTHKQIQKTFGEKMNTCYLKNSNSENSKNEIAKGLTKIVFNYKDYNGESDHSADNVLLQNYLIENYQLNLTFKQLCKKVFVKTLLNITPNKSLRSKIRKKFHVY